MVPPRQAALPQGLGAAADARLEWVLGDTGDLPGLAGCCSPRSTGGLVGAASGHAGRRGRRWPAWAAPESYPDWSLLGLGLFAAGLGVVLAPWTLRAAARFNRRMLGGALLRSGVDGRRRRGCTRYRAWFGRHAAGRCRLAWLFLTSCSRSPVFVVTILGLLGGFGLGIDFLCRPC